MIKKKAPIADCRSAIAGESFSFVPRLQIRPGLDGVHTVQPKSAGNDGQWICISCGLPLDNQIEKDTHCAAQRRGPSQLGTELGERAWHVLAWRSFASGQIEEP